jgi:3'(2'), 5'-bisphosphate nucleotidase
MLLDQNFVNMMIDLMRECDQIVLDIYNSDDFDVEIKNDKSPLTKADKMCNEHIVSFIKKNFSDHNIAIISEENPEDHTYESRRQFEYCWLIDPIDGTKEFIKRNGQFTINVGLVRNGTPIFGIVSIPVFNQIYYGCEGLGSFKFCHKEKNIKKLHIDSSKDFSSTNVRIVASSSHLNQDTENFIKLFKEPCVVNSGSSIKLLYIADDQADIYPRLGPTSEWDTCAAHAVVKFAGGHVLKVDANSVQKLSDINADKLTELSYNKENLLNSYFIVF